MSVVFGNDDPEDAWDESDPLPVRVALVRRIVDSIVAEAMVTGPTPRVIARRYHALGQLVGFLALAELVDERPDLQRLHARLEAVA